MKKFLLSTALVFAFAAPASAKVCGSANGTGSDAALFNFYNGSCSSDNQANDGDDLKAFLDSTSNVTGANIDFSLTKNTNLALDQNTAFKDLSTTPGVIGFTDGNGFANIKSTNDVLQSWEIDPINGSIFGKLGIAFPGFDGLLFRGQFSDLNSGNIGKASFTLTINLSDGSSVSDTFSNLKLNADDGVFGFDEIGTLPKGLFVDSVDGKINGAFAWDQMKQVEFSVPGATAAVPEPSTWILSLLGFAILGFFGYRKSLKHSATTAIEAA